MVNRKSIRKRARIRSRIVEDVRVLNHSVPPVVLTAEVVCCRLQSVLHSIRTSMSTVIVSIEALRRQDADADSDVATILHQHVSDPLSTESERISDLIALIETHGVAAGGRAASQDRSVTGPA